MQERNPRPPSVHDTATAPSDLLNLHEIVAKARQNLNQNAWDYIVGGAETETTLRRNRMALDAIAFRPRVLRDVSKVDASVEPVRPQACACRSCSRRSARWRLSSRRRRPVARGGRRSSASPTC